MHGGAIVSGSFQGFDQRYLIASLQALGKGFVGVAQNYGSVGEAAKWILSFSMLIGKLEVLTIIAIFHRAFWRQ